MGILGASQSQAEVILHIRDVQVVQVEERVAKLLDQGPLVLSVKDGSVSATVNGGCSWELHPTLPALKAATFSYTFAVQGGGVFYSLLLAHGTPVEEAALLEEILSQCTAFEVYQSGAGVLSKAEAEQAISRVEEELIAEEAGGGASSSVTPYSTSQELQGLQGQHSERIARGAAKLTTAIASGASWAATKMESSSQALKDKLVPSKSPIPVPSVVKGSVKAMRKTAWAGAGAAGYASSKTADIALRISDSIIKRLGGSAFGSYLNAGGSKRSKAAREIAAASLVAASQVYDSMEEAAILVLNSAKDSSSSVIAHKYGPDAGQLARDATSAGLGVVVGAKNVKSFGVQSMATRIAKRTSKGLVIAAVNAAKEQQKLQAPTTGPATIEGATGGLHSPFARLAQKEADAAATKGVQAMKH